MSTTAPVVREDKYTFDKTTLGGITHIAVRGTLNEDFEGRKLAAMIKTKSVILSMRDVIRFASWGMTEWMDFLRSTAERDVYIVECSMYACSQLHLVTGLLGHAKLVSFYASYRCTSCTEEMQTLFVIPRDRAAIRAIPGSTRDCPTCGKTARLEEYPAALFEMIAARSGFDIADDALGFMRSHLKYDISPDVSRFRAYRRTFKDYTYLRLSGDIATLPPDALANASKATALVHLDNIQFDGNHLEAWRNYLSLALPKVKSLQLVDCPPGFLESAVTIDDLRANLKIRTFIVSLECGTCGARPNQIVDVAANLEELVQGTIPAARCPSCRATLSTKLPPELANIVRALPARDRDPALDGFLGKTRNEAPDKLENCLASAAPQQPSRNRGVYVALGAGLLAVGGGAIVATKLLRKDANANNANPQGSGTVGSNTGQVTGPPKFTRPDWITSDVSGSAYCRDLINRLMCVGVSSYTTNKDQGVGEATDGALEELVSSVGLRIADPFFKDSVMPEYTDIRAKALAALQAAELDRARDQTTEKDYAQASNVVRTARRRVVDVLRATGGAAVPAQRSDWYWEEYTKESGSGTEFLIFVRFDVSLDAMRVLVEKYSESTPVLGSTAMTTFPELAWSHTKLTGGALLTKVGKPLTGAGLEPQQIITAVAGERVNDAPTLAKRVADGTGPLELTVLVGDTAPATVTLKR